MNPWFSIEGMFDVALWVRALKNAKREEVRTGHSLSESFYPIIMSVTGCLQGVGEGCGEQLKHTRFSSGRWR